MKRSVVETVLGAVVLVVAAFFLAFSYKAGNARKITGYEITAAFSGVGGLAAGDDILISGVKIGSVSSVDLDPKTYLAQVHMSIDPSVKLPADTAAMISSQSLLGGRYLQLEPGADEEMLKPGGRIQYTQAPQNLEQLLGQFIFSMKKDNGDKGAANQSAAPGTAAAASPAAGHP
jgi:phospholipid/cholesterol/gamma-HCH transport system substrate-binding protein